MRKYTTGFFMILLFIIEWVFDMIVKLFTVLHEGVKEAAIYAETTYNEIKDEPDSRTDK